MNTVQEKARVNGVVLVRDAFIDIFIPSLSRRVYSIQLPNTVYTNMEVIDEQSFMKVILEFVGANALPPLNAFILIQSPIFKKEFALLPAAQMDVQVQAYVDYIPFDTVISKRIQSEKGTAIIATNGDYVDTLKRILTQAGWLIECVTPLEAIPFAPKGGVPVLSESLGTALFKNESIMRQGAFQVSVQKETDEFEVVDMPDKPIQAASQLPLLLGVFGILLAVLVAVYINMGKDFGLTPRPVRRKTIVPTAIPKQSPAVKGASTSIIPPIRIQYAPGQEQHLHEVYEKLVNAGIEQIITSDILPEPNDRTVAFITTSIPDEAIKIVVRDLLTAIPSLETVRVSDSANSIILLLGK